MKTVSEYLDSLRELKTEIYFMGKKVDNVVDHPAFRPHINSTSVTYQIANMEEYQSASTAVSHLGRRINRGIRVMVPLAVK